MLFFIREERFLKKNWSELKTVKILFTSLRYWTHLNNLKTGCISLKKINIKWNILQDLCKFNPEDQGCKNGLCKIRTYGPMTNSIKHQMGARSRIMHIPLKWAFCTSKGDPGSYFDNNHHCSHALMYLTPGSRNCN